MNPTHRVGVVKMKNVTCSESSPPLWRPMITKRWYCISTGSSTGSAGSTGYTCSTGTGTSVWYLEWEWLQRCSALLYATGAILLCHPVAMCVYVRIDR